MEYRLRKKSGGKISLTKSPARTRASSRSWMSEYGLGRSYFRKSVCPDCGEERRERYIRHPFPLPAGFKKGEWLLSDCACVRAARRDTRSVLDNILIERSRHPLPVGLRSKTFKSFQVDELNRSAVQACEQFVRNFEKITGGQGILLLGRSGTGKTHLACSIVNSLYPKYSVLFRHVPTLMERMRYANVDLEPLLAADLLLLDDVGSERITGWTAERLLIIVDGRLTSHKPTVFTTNFATQDFEARMGMRLASRILGSNLHLLLKGPDRRLVRHGL